MISEKLVVDEDGDGLAAPEEELTYTINVKNTGNLDELNVVVQDDLSLLEGNVDYALSDLVEVNNDGNITYYTIQDLINGITIPTIVANTEVNLSFTVIVKKDLDNETISVLSNVAKVNGKEIDCEIPVLDAVYTIVYHGNGHTVGIEPIDAKLYYANDQITLLSENDLAKSGHSYVSWNTKADGSGTSYYAKDNKECLVLYNEAGDGNRTIHLYAIWNKVEKKPSIATGDDTNKTVALSLSMLLMSAFAIIMVRSKKRKSL